jgi:uncharacterized protein (TIGR00369 family)
VSAAASLSSQAREMSGLEFIAAVRDGDLPPAPIQDLLGFDLVESSEGRTVFALLPEERHYNPIGAVHGGVAATLLDSAMGAAVHTTLPLGSAYSTLETKFNLVRAITADTGEIRAEGVVIHRGRRVATAEGRITRASDGKLLAHGTSTCLVI